eukprot:8636330-Pyramimonas_sp.AAC.1
MPNSKGCPEPTAAAVGQATACLKWTWGSTDPSQSRPGPVRLSRIQQHPAGSCRTLHPSLGQCTPGSEGSCWRSG